MLMTNSSIVTAFLVTLGLPFAIHPARAVPLSSIVVNVDTGNGTGTGDDFNDVLNTTGTFGAFTSPGNTGSGTVALFPSPNVFANDSASDLGGFAHSRLTITYFFSAIGALNASVPIDVTASGAVTADGIGGTHGLAVLDVNNVALFTACAGGCLSGAVSSFDATRQIFVPSNTAVSVVVDLDVLAFPLTLGALSSASGFIDPTIAIDPAVAGQFVLDLSPDVGNSPEISAPTPLPAALPLFASGVGALGFFGWRRKRNLLSLGGGGLPIWARYKSESIWGLPCPFY